MKWEEKEIDDHSTNSKLATRSAKIMNQITTNKYITKERLVTTRESYHNKHVH